MALTGQEQQVLIASELTALQGAWRQVGLESDGVVNPPDEHTMPGALCWFEDTHFVVRSPDDSVLLEGDFTLEPWTHPKSITWVDSVGEDAGKPLPAIYVLDGDNFCFIAADEKLPRPTVFKTERGLTMRTFVRHRQPAFLDPQK